MRAVIILTIVFLLAFTAVCYGFLLFMLNRSRISVLCGKIMMCVASLTIASLFFVSI